MTTSSSPFGNVGQHIDDFLVADGCSLEKPKEVQNSFLGWGTELVSNLSIPGVSKLTETSEPPVKKIQPAAELSEKGSQPTVGSADEQPSQPNFFKWGSEVVSYIQLPKMESFPSTSKDFEMKTEAERVMPLPTKVGDQRQQPSLVDNLTARIPEMSGKQETGMIPQQQEQQQQQQHGLQAWGSDLLSRLQIPGPPPFTPAADTAQQARPAGEQPQTSLLRWGADLMSKVPMPGAPTQARTGAAEPGGSGADPSGPSLLWWGSGPSPMPTMPVAPLAAENGPRGTAAEGAGTEEDPQPQADRPGRASDLVPGTRSESPAVRPPAADAGAPAPAASGRPPQAKALPGLLGWGADLMGMVKMPGAPGAARTEPVQAELRGTPPGRGLDSETLLPQQPSSPQQQQPEQQQPQPQPQPPAQLQPQQQQQQASLLGWGQDLMAKVKLLPAQAAAAETGTDPVASDPSSDGRQGGWLEWGAGLLPAAPGTAAPLPIEAPPPMAGPEKGTGLPPAAGASAQAPASAAAAVRPRPARDAAQARWAGQSAESARAARAGEPAMGGGGGTGGGGGGAAAAHCGRAPAHTGMTGQGGGLGAGAPLSGRGSCSERSVDAVSVAQRPGGLDAAGRSDSEAQLEAQLQVARAETEAARARAEMEAARGRADVAEAEAEAERARADALRAQLAALGPAVTQVEGFEGVGGGGGGGGGACLVSNG
jgi:hypothetical protein